GLLPRWWSGEFTPPLRGGVAARSRKSREASLARADGVVFNLQQNSAEFDHHPVRSTKEASRYFIEVAASPPRRGGENRALCIWATDATGRGCLNGESHIPLLSKEGRARSAARGGLFNVSRSGSL